MTQLKQRMAAFIAIIVTAMLPWAGVQAQDSLAKKLSLREAIDLSVKNNKQLKASKARIDQAVAAVRIAKDDRLPDFKVSGSYLRLNNPNVKLKSGSGGGADSNKVEVSQALYGLANVTYPIYQGGRLRYGIESAKYLEQAAKLDAESDRDAVVLNTIEAYINLYKAGAAVALVKENLAQSQQRDKDFANLEKNGLLARNDLLKVQLQTSNIELSLMDAENNVKLANVNVDLMLGLPERTSIETDSTLMDLPLSIQALEAYEQQALDNRKDAKALNLRGKSAAASIRSAKSEYYPGLALTGGYVAAHIPGFLTITNAVNIGVGVQYSLSSLWKTKAKVDQAKARENEVLANQEALSDNIRYQINEAYQAYLLNQKKIEVYEKAIDQATENYKITKNKYDNSLVNTTDLLDADVAQLQAKLNRTFAKADAVVAYNRLLQVAGLIDTQK